MGIGGSRGGVTPPTKGFRGESLPLRLLSNIPSAVGEKIINQKEAENQLKARGKIKRFGIVCSDSIRNTLPDSLRNTLPSAPDFNKYPTVGPTL